MKRLLVVLVLSAAVLAAPCDLTGQTKKEKVEVKGKEKKVKAAPAPTEDRDEAVGKTADGKIVYEGSRGGHYYLTESGNKTYVDDFIGAKIVGKTPDGRNIYEGPRGGRFYYSASGNKVYVKRK